MPKGRYVPDVSADLEILPQSKRRSIAMSEIKKVKPTELYENPLNSSFFDPEAAEHLKKLKEDIQTRGILVPLIAKTDGMLLAGHNRLLVARELNLPLVPVQYVQEQLSEEGEREFIIKDNLLRRQLSTDQRISLYKRLYPEFEATFLNGVNKGGRTKKDDGNRLTIEKIAEETSQKPEAVKKQIQRFRDKTGDSVPGLPKKQKVSKEETGDSVPGFSESSRSNGISATEVNDSAILMTAKQLLAMYKAADEEERQQVRELLKEAALA